MGLGIDREPGLLVFRRLLHGDQRKRRTALGAGLAGLFFLRERYTEITDLSCYAA
jgi:hypothetical protein